MRKLPLAWVFLVFFVFSACNKERAEKPANVDASASSAPNASTVAPTTSQANPTARPASLADDELEPGLPRLKPVNKEPFPEGATQQQVCEAINATDEQDLWLRFGHMIPLYRLGAVYIIDGAEKEVAIIEEFVTKQYIPGLFLPDLSVCPGKGILLYLANMKEAETFYGKKYGREHLTQELKKRGVVVRESHSTSLSERLGEYCRADAELCERLVKLDRFNKGRGLCLSAESVCRKTIESGVEAIEQWQRKCSALAPEALACLEYRRTLEENRRCKSAIAQLLCPNR